MGASRHLGTLASRIARQARNTQLALQKDREQSGLEKPQSPLHPWRPQPSGMGASPHPATCPSGLVPHLPPQGCVAL